MLKPYLVIVNGRLAGRKLTRQSAQRVVESFLANGVSASLAQELPNGEFQPLNYEKSIWAYLNSEHQR